MSHSLASISALAEADYLTKGLLIAPNQSPSAPCFVTLPVHLFRLDLFIHEISTERSIPFVSLLRSDYAPVLDAAVTFANSIWTPEQLKTFESCSCQRHDMELVKSFRRDAYEDARGYCEGYGPLQEIVRRIFMMISNVVCSIYLNPADVIRLEKGPRNCGKWPSSPSIIMPHGPATVVSAFIAWASLIEDATPIHTLSVLSHICPSVQPAMARNKDWLPILASLFSRFVLSIQKITQVELSPFRKQAVERDICNYMEIFGATWFRFQIYACSNPDHDDIPLFKSIYNATCDFLAIIDRFDFSNLSAQHVKEKFGILAFCLYSAVVIATSDVEALPFLETLAPYAHYCDQDHVRAIHLYTDLRALRSLAKCAEMTCTKTSESTKTNFKKCSQCQTVRYCSQTCQAADWKIHKGVCSRLKVLMPIAITWVNIRSGKGADELRRRYLDELEEVGLTDEDTFAVSEYAISHNKPWLKDFEAR